MPAGSLKKLLSVLLTVMAAAMVIGTAIIASAKEAPSIDPAGSVPRLDEIANNGIVTPIIPNISYRGIKIRKIDESTRPADKPVDGNTTYLNGARFALYQWNGIEYIRRTSATTASMRTDSGTVVGIASFDDLEDGEYMIEETGVPAGFVKLHANNIYFKVEYRPDETQIITRYKESKKERGEGEGTEMGADSLSSVETLYITFGLEGEEYVFIVGNTPGSVLPATGGPGTRMTCLISILLIALAGVGLILARRKRELL